MSRKWACNGLLIQVGLLLSFAVGACGRQAPAQQEGPEPHTARIQGRSVEDVIRENLSAWHFRPGKQVFVKDVSCRVPCLDLDVGDDGRLYLAWVEQQGDGDVIKMATSHDGEQWQADGEFPRTPAKVDAVAIAARAAPSPRAGLPSAVLLWFEGNNLVASLRSEKGRWGAAGVLWETGLWRGSVALASEPSGQFDALVQAITGATSGMARPALLTWDEQRGWARPVELSEPINWPVQLGCWGTPHTDLVTVGYAQKFVTAAVLAGRDGDWRVEGTPGWRSPQVASLWAAPGRTAAALVAPQWPTNHGACLTSSEDLGQWSQPVFLGLNAVLGKGHVIAVAGDPPFVATVCGPFWDRNLEPFEAWIQELRGHGPRVFRLDDGLTRDTDGDGLTDITEEWWLTDHQNPDTDGDGVTDSADRDPLARARGKGDEARIREAVLEAACARAPDDRYERVVIVKSSRRQAFSNDRIRVLSLTPEEVGGYEGKYGLAALTVISITNVKIAPAGDRATAEWESYSGPKSALGKRAQLERRNGQWVVTESTVTWIT